MSVDWPVGIATRQIASSIVKRIRYSNKNESIEAIVLTSSVKRSNMLTRGMSLRVGLTRGEQARSRLDSGGPIVKRCSEATDLLLALQRRIGKAQISQLIRLFELLLGTTVLRPLRSRSGWSDPSSLYWASIYHNLIDEATVKSIMESVIIPPGKGSSWRGDIEPVSSPGSPETGYLRRSSIAELLRKKRVSWNGRIWYWVRFQC